jgi:hypothetical protein
MLNEMERLHFQMYELRAPDKKPSEHSQKNVCVRTQLR